MKPRSVRVETDLEHRLLRNILREIRNASARRLQLLITVDPWYSGDGANLFIGYAAQGWSESVEGRIRKRRCAPFKTRGSR